MANYRIRRLYNRRKGLILLLLVWSYLIDNSYLQAGLQL